MEKSKRKFQTIEEYIETFPKSLRSILNELQQSIKKSALEAVETISYNIPTFKLNGNLLHFAAYKNHIGFYPTPTAIIEFKKELSLYETSKGSVKFPINKPLPLSLIEKIVKYRVKENLEKKKEIRKRVCPKCLKILDLLNKSD